MFFCSCYAARCGPRAAAEDAALGPQPQMQAANAAMRPVILPQQGSSMATAMEDRQVYNRARREVLSNESPHLGNQTHGSSFLCSTRGPKAHLPAPFERGFKHVFT